MKNRIESKSVPLDNIQLYNSERIVLRRSHRKGESLRARSGRIKVKRGKSVETVIIRKKTPGICRTSDSSGCTVIFEKGDSDGIHFRLSSSDYILDADNRGKPLEPQKITYKGKEYTILKGHEAQLVLRKSSRFVKDRDRQYVHGMKIK